MKSQRGIALIATLMIMAAIMALGFGSLFLTDMNTRISENARGNAIAKSQADAGVDVALILLSQTFENQRRFPTNLELPIIDGFNYRLLNYESISPGYQRAVIKIEGRGDNNARYVADATFAADTYRAFEVGIASQRTVSFTAGGGGNTKLRNSRIHGNLGVSLSSAWSSSNFEQCTLKPEGGCVEGTYQVMNPTPVSASDGNNCSSPCSTNRAPPIKIDVNYRDERSDTIAIKTFGLVRYEGNPNRDSTGELLYARRETPNTPISINPANTNLAYGSEPYNTSNGFCTKSYSSNLDLSNASVNGAGFSPNDVICVRGSVTLPANVNLSNVTIIAHGHINFGSTTARGPAGELNNVRLITRNDVDPNNNGVRVSSIANASHLTIFSGANAFANNNCHNRVGAPCFVIGSNFNLRDHTTIFSSVGIDFDGKTSLTKRNGVDTVTIAIISEKNIHNNGNNAFFGTFWMGGTFSQQGSANVFGSIAAVGDISTSGGFNVLRDYPIYNEYLLGDTVALSRR